MYLVPGKHALVKARVGKRMRALGIADEGAYLQYVLNDATGHELVQLLNVMSTNVTRFFREPDHFTFLREMFGQWLQEGRRRIRLWSAACSTGEEPYSIAMTILDSLPRGELGGLDLKILATDISTRVLETAEQARYSDTSLKEVPPVTRQRFFVRAEDGSQPTYQVRESLKRLVTFRRLNLAAPPFPLRGPFDAIFCRNVMIYFDGAVRKRLLGELERLLRPDGWLLIGHSENLLGVQPDSLQMVSPSVYRKVPRPAAVADTGELGRKGSRAEIWVS
jgi:chemotaxis protein methyltransferase CheR